MRQYSRYGRSLVLGLTATLGVWSLQAEAITYNVTIVQFETGIESYDFNTGMYTGQVNGAVRSSNLPLSLTTTSASYLSPTGVSQAQFQNIMTGGTWSLSDGGGNEIFGNFSNLTRNQGFGGSPLGYGTGSSEISGGTGVFSQASGSSSFEVFARDYSFVDANQVYYQAYEQVLVNRMQITLADGPTQTDTRNVVVSMRVGVNHQPTETGVNIGGPMSDDAPASNPRLTHLRSEYAFGGSELHEGLSFGRNVAGDGTDWRFDFETGSNLGGFFFATEGTADLLEGYGFYEGYSGHSDWIGFESGMGWLGPDQYTYSNVVIDRMALQAPVPEPETYALVLAGLAALGLAARRRRPIR